MLYFQGLVFDENGKERDICVDIIPPLPIMKNNYWCGKEFLIDSIIDLYQTHDTYGIVLIGGDEVIMYNFSGSRASQIDHLTIYRQKNHKMGGQSAQRFDRIHDNQVDEYVKKISERINTNYIDRSNSSCKVKRIIVSGVGDIKDRVLRNGWLDKIIVSKLTRLLTLSKLSIVKVIDELPSLIKETNTEDDSKFLEEIDNYIQKDDNTIVYGDKEIEEAIVDSKLKEIYVHESILVKIKDKVEICGCNIKILKSYNERCVKFLENYGGMFGILWFSSGRTEFDLIE